ncbi:MAG: SoxR reducing system RseC family protein [Clostridia bacterium]
MIAKATVALVDGRLMAEVIRSEACHKCGQCQMGRQEKQHYPLPEGDYHVGDQVEMHLPDETAFPAALIAYGIPLFALLLGLGIAAALKLPDVWQAVVALASAVAGYFVLKALEPKIKRSGRFTPRCGKDE